MTMAVIPWMLLPVLVAACAGYLAIAAFLWLGTRYLDHPILWQWGRLLAIGSVWTVLVVAGANILWAALEEQGFRQLSETLYLALVYSFPLQLLAPPLYSFLACGISKYRETRKAEQPPKEEPNA